MIAQKTVLECDVLIAGGGIAGIEAADALHRRGDHPILCEAGDSLGGQWNFWFPCFLGLVAQAVTGNFVTGILGALVAVMLQWLL